jgi:gliding motility-associated-like protein
MKLFFLSLMALLYSTIHSQVFNNVFNATGLPIGNTTSQINLILDYNNDGFEDLIYQYDTLGSNHVFRKLYRNQGNGIFVQNPLFNIESYLEIFQGINTVGWMKTFDFNNDGYPDIVCQQEDTLRFLQNDSGSGIFIDKTSCFGINGVLISKSEFAKNELDLDPIYLSDIDNDNDIDLVFGRINAANNKSIWMLENELNDSLKFNSLIEIIPNFSSTYNPLVITFDYDRDFDEDLLAINQFGWAYAVYPLKLYRNDGNLNFTDVTLSSNIGSSSWWGFAKSSDIDNDGDLDLIIGSTDANIPNQIKINNGNGTFTTNTTAVESGNFYYERCQIIDFDNDMDWDVNWQGSGFGFAGAPLLANQSNLSFVNQAPLFGIFNYTHVWSQRAAGLINWIDVNNDGLLDHFRSKGNFAGPFLYQNSLAANNNYLKIKLKSCSNNRDAIGSIVKVCSSGDCIYQTNTGNTLESAGGPNGMFFHFGLNQNTQVDSLVVYWSTGNTSSLYNLPVNQKMIIEETPGCENTTFVGILPDFQIINELCYGTPINPLDSLSNNGILGSWSPSFSNTNSETYTFIPNANFCALPYLDSITIHPIPALTSVDYEICKGDSVTVQSQTNLPLGNFLWSNGDTANFQTIAPLITDTMTVVYELNGCVSLTDTLIIQVNDLPVAIISSSGPLTFCNQSSVVLSSSSTTGNLWSTGSTNQSIEIQSTSNIVLTVVDTNGCANFDTVNVANSQISCFSYPTIFTPNGDGVNDTWEIQGVEFYPSMKVQIFNRWGQQLFSSDGYSTPWNGTYKHEPLPTGDYFFIIDLGDGNPINGALTLKN